MFRFIYAIHDRLYKTKIGKPSKVIRRSVVSSKIFQLNMYVCMRELLRFIRTNPSFIEMIINQIECSCNRLFDPKLWSTMDGTVHSNRFIIWEVYLFILIFSRPRHRVRASRSCNPLVLSSSVSFWDRNFSSSSPFFDWGHVCLHTLLINITSKWLYGVTWIT